MSVSKRPTQKKSASKKSDVRTGHEQDKRQLLAERLQKLQDGSLALKGEMERLRRRLAS